MATKSLNVKYGGGVTKTTKRNVTLINEKGDTITLPIVAPTTSYGELAPNWTQVPRPGLVAPAYNVRGPRPLRTITLQVTVATLDTNFVPTNEPVDDLLQQITSFLQDATAITLSYATFDNAYVTAKGTWVCTSWQPAVLYRDPDSWSAMSVQGNLTLTEANPQPFASGVPQNVVFSTGPNSTQTHPNAATVPANSQKQAGSSKVSYPEGQNASTASGTAQQGSKVWNNSQPTNQSAATTIAPPGTPKQSKYTVVSGDTLTSISVKMYSTPSGWRAIAQANNITDPRLLQVGTVLTIPSPAKKSS